MNKQVEMAQERATGVYEMVSDMAQKAMLVGLGAVDFVREEVTDLINDSSQFTNKLVERGETVAKDGRERANTMVEKPQARVKHVAHKAEERFDHYTEWVLSRINVPTSREIGAVDKKLAALNRKLDRIARLETEEIGAVDRKLDNLNRKLSRVAKTETEEIEAVEKKVETVSRKLDKAVKAETI
jgi:poly(hydroxyalkanoate) granule-associated protein